VFVIVQDSAEAVVSWDVEMGNLAGFGERCGQAICAVED
jgi:hypothetical protein